MAYPLASRFRTGTTLAMFTLVVFTLVTGAVDVGSFIRRSRTSMPTAAASTCARAPRRALRSTTCARRSPRRAGHRPGTSASLRSQSFLPLEARQQGTGRRYEPYPLRGLDATFLTHTTSASARSRADTPRPPRFGGPSDEHRARGRRQLRGAAARQLQLRHRPRLQAQWVPLRGRRLCARAGGGARSADRTGGCT